jgi:hypothetical protein
MEIQYQILIIFEGTSDHHMYTHISDIALCGSSINKRKKISVTFLDAACLCDCDVPSNDENG